MNNNSPLVTLGMLTYNNLQFLDESYLRKAIESLINQDYLNKEILIFDDHSTDGTFEICQEYAIKYPIIRLNRHKKNIGCFPNFETVLNNITGKYFLWACADDWYAKDYISKCIKKFETDNSAIIVSTALRIFYDNGDIRTFHYEDFNRKLPFRKIVRNILKDVDSLGNHIRCSPMIHSSLIRASFIPKLYCKEQFFVMEEAWFLNALVWGKIKYINEVLYFRTSLSILHDIKNPTVGQKLSKPFGYIENIYNYIKYFWSRPFPLIKKLKYMHLALIAIRVRAIPKIMGLTKVFIMNHLIRKIGLMRYDSK